MTDNSRYQCYIAGGGPAGMMLGYLLGRAGVRTVVVEKHADFLRDFRGDTVHPSTMLIMKELGLLQDFLKLPHSQLRALSLQFEDRTIRVADFSRVPTPCRFIALMPQWDFLNFLAERGRRFPALTVKMSTQIVGLIEASGRVIGVRTDGPTGSQEILADLVVGCDGRSSTVRAASGLAVQDLGAPIDVLWFRLSKKSGDQDQIMGHIGKDTMVVTIDRGEYWQCAYVIAKGGIERIRAGGMPAFQRAVAAGARFLSDRVQELTTFEDVKLLSVSVDRLNTWSKPGLLCIGDAAHAMSPVGGVGINLAIQDAVATANLLAAKLAEHDVLTDEDLDAVRRRRLFPAKAIQSLQVTVHNRLLKPLVSGGNRSLKIPWPMLLLNSSASLRRWPAQFLGLGLRPEHVRSPEAKWH